MQNEQTPAAGPLTAESARLLVKGDCVRCAEGVGFVGIATADYITAYIDDRAYSRVPSHFTFLGRPDQDGWIAWHGGENPVPGAWVDVRLRNGHIMKGCNDLSWSHPAFSDRLVQGVNPDGLGDIIAYRPHVPSPASSSSVVQGDASGVGREGIELTFGMGALVVNTGTFGGDNAVFIAKATEPGPVGAYTGKAAFRRDVLQPGEHVLIFPTAQHAQAVADALVGAAPVASSDQPKQGGGLPPISFDGPQKIDDQRAWLARQLLDSKLDDDEAYSIVRNHPGLFPAEARVRELSEERDRNADELLALVDRWEARATAAEAKLARFETAAKIYRDDGDCQDFRDALAALQEAGEVG